jgi:hypothetical protein
MLVPLTNLVLKSPKQWSRHFPLTKPTAILCFSHSCHLIFDVKMDFTRKTCFLQDSTWSITYLNAPGKYVSKLERSWVRMKENGWFVIT